DFIQVLQPCRFSALVIVSAGLLLISDQGHELSRRLGGEGAPNRQTVLFFICVFLWAFQSWYFARLVLDAVFGLARTVKFGDPQREKRVSRMIRHLPRLLALAAFFIAAGTLLLSAAWTLAGITVALGIVFYWVLVRRQRWTTKYARPFMVPRLGVTYYAALK